MPTRLFLLALCPVYFSVATIAHAEASRRILYVVASEAPEELSTAVRAQVADLPATPLWQIEPTPATQVWVRRAETLAVAHDVAAVMWLDVDTLRSELIVYLRENDETYVRRFQASPDYPMAARIEELSAVAREITLAVLEGRPVRLERLAQPFAPSLRLDLGYRLTGLTSSTAQQSAMAVANVEPLSWLAFGLSYGYAAPLRLSESSTRVRLQAQSLRSSAAFRLGDGRLKGGIGLTSTLQWTRRVTETLPSSASSSKAATNFEIGLGPMVEGELALFSRLSLVASLGAEVYVRRTHYEVHGDVTMEIVPWRLRPYAGLGVAWRFR